MFAGIVRHVRQQYAGFLALFIALGGVSYAAVTLPANSVTSKQIKRGAVNNADLAKNAVTSAKVKNGSLLSADFKPGQLVGAPGATGSQGPKGDKGDPGAKGDAGTARAYATIRNTTPPTVYADIKARNVTGVRTAGSSSRFCVAIDPSVPVTDDLYVQVFPDFLEPSNVGYVSRATYARIGQSSPCTAQEVYVATYAFDAGGGFTPQQRGFSILIP